MNTHIKVLVVDDSSWMRKIVSETLSAIPGLEVVGKARNGQHALDLIESCQPDLLTLDIEMPVLNGLETLKALNQSKNFSVKVIMISSVDNRETTFWALENGASDFIEKPVDIKAHYAQFKEQLQRRIHALFEDQPSSLCSDSSKGQLLENKQVEAVVIGASTGGPKALVDIVKKLPKTLNVPVLIVQHMPERFTATFAERLHHLAAVPVVEAKHNMKIEPGVVYIAPGNYHMVLNHDRIHLNQEAKIHGVRPAVDPLFASAAQVYQNHLVGIVLTGMGKDGAEGCQEILRLGGYTMAQNKETSIVYGMPRHAVESGVIREVASLTQVSTRLNRMVGMKNGIEL